MANTIIVVLTALCSGLIATLVTIWWQKQNAQKAEKVRIFTVLMSKRYNIIAEECVDALNMIDIVFYSDKKVRTAWKEFHDATNMPEQPMRGQIINDKHLKLLEVMAEAIGYKDIRWEEIKRSYFPQGLSDKNEQEAVLRGVQIQVALEQIKEKHESNASAQVNNEEMLKTQMVLSALENPDKFLKFIEAAEKAQNFGKAIKPKR